MTANTIHSFSLEQTSLFASCFRRVCFLHVSGTNIVITANNDCNLIHMNIAEGTGSLLKQANLTIIELLCRDGN